MGPTPLSGRQHTLRSGGYEAVVASVGASLRSLTYEGRDLVAPYGADDVRPAYRGATLAPWPNRVIDGRYRFEGTERRLALTEPARGHALHGLAAWLDFAAVDEGADHVTLAATIQPQTGYPWRIQVETTYALGAEGLAQTVRARNDSGAPAPWGVGPHPYLVAARGGVDDWTLTLPASQVLETTADRLVPVRLSPVEVDAARFDFRAPRRIGQTKLDHAFTGLHRDPAGATAVTVVDADGRGAAIEWDAGCPWVQVHTADQPDPTSPLHRAGVAVEPMTCAPDALNDPVYPFDTGLHVLPPGAESPLAQWHIRAVG